MLEEEAYLEQAREYYEKGMRLFSGGDFYDAAEKIWGAIRSATMALT